ncbi:MAG: hypothetical protein OQK67_01615 [Chlorobium sp.]|nr:hypothetical protein [Chlorobium sp.]MCW8814965.1 hypothetical protein [Chlorobium sp.]MCW8819474.1 hypothetical protein [Ignavibacteriaceae bacterium]
MMKTTHTRTILAGIAGGVSMNVVMLLTFRLLGFGWNGGGILLESPVQSEKLIAVWTQIEPIPLVVNAPAPIIAGIVIFGIVNAYVFRSIASAWPPGIGSRGLRFSVLVFSMTFLFWEFFTPFNMFGEPLRLISLELVFWACIALADGIVIAAVSHRRQT